MGDFGLNVVFEYARIVFLPQFESGWVSMNEDLWLPTREELEQLYTIKTHKAVLWYTWRNALRAVAVLGYKPLNDTWSNETINKIYQILRAVFILNENIINFDVLDFSKKISANDDAINYATGVVSYAINVAIAPSIYAYGARAAPDTIEAYKKIKLDGIKTNKIIQSIRASVKMDMNFLLSRLLVESKLPPLWTDKLRETHQLEESLLKDLADLNLDFLALDLKKVWSGQKIGKHAKNYLKTYSSIITRNPIALRRAILYEEITEYSQSVRVLLLGSGGAGKSSLADRLQANPIQQFKSSTQGIDYLNHQSLKLEEKHPDFKLETNDLDLYLWDFGGQTIFHGLHSAFLHENCVYVLVVDSRHEQAPDEWLHQIRHLAGNQANVLLITNEYENCKTQQNQKRLLREFPDLLNGQSFFYFSCLMPESGAFKVFLKKLIQVSSESRRAIFKSTLDIRDELSTRYQSEVFLNLDEVEEIIADKVEIEGYRPSTLTQLEQLGFIIPAKGEKYCLNPVWVVDNAYKVLYSDEVRNNHGIISLNAIRKILNCSDKYQAEILVRDLLQERALCCAISKTEYFFPDAASTNEPDQATKIIENPILTLRFDVPYLPLGFHARLVHKLYNPTRSVTIQNTEDIWRQGFILKVIEQKQIKAQAVIHYLLRKSAIEMVFNGEVEFFAALLENFYPQLDAALDTSAAHQKIKIQTLVSDDAQNLLAIPSGYKLIDALKKASTPNEIAEQVNKMTKENAINITAGAGSQIIIGDGNKQKANSNNTNQPASVVGSSSNTATVTPDTIKAERRQRLLTKLSDLYKQYDYETRVEEKMRIKALIDDTQQELNSL